MEIGELRANLSRDLMEVVWDIVDQPKMKKKRIYYIFIYSREESGVVNTKVVVSDIRPAQCGYEPLGTMCFKINNVDGRATKEWILPLDIPRDESIIDNGKPDKTILHSAGGKLIVH